MGHTLKIVYGSTTIDLSAGDYRIKTYSPSPPRANRDTVVEGISVFIEASSVADLQSDIRAIENAFYLAQQRRIKRLGDRVYLTFLEDGDTITYRSEIYADNESDLPGTVFVDTQWLRSVMWDQKVVEAKISLERRNYWEASTETELSLANGSQTAATGGCTIYNPSTTAVFTNTTVSFAATNSRISDSGDGFSIFATGDVINLRGSTSNDGVYTVDAVAGDGSYIDVNQVISNEGAGDTINIYDVQNYVHIAAAAITGNLPCPVRIAATNNDAGDDLETLWINGNINSTPAEFPHLLEVEDSDTVANTNDAGASGGSYRTYSVTTSNAKLTGWTLPSQLLSVATGAYFRVIARFWDSTDITNVRLALRVYYSGGLIYDGGQVDYDDTYATTVNLLRELDTIQLPPTREPGTPSDLTLQLWGISTTGSTETIKVDCLFLMPLDSHRKLKSVSGVAQNSILVDDPFAEVYYQEVSSKRVPDIIGFGDYIWATPGKDLRIYFLQNSEANAKADINRAMSISCYIRPRIATL
jgi:hypothetical protein